MCSTLLLLFRSKPVRVSSEEWLGLGFQERDGWKSTCAAVASASVRLLLMIFQSNDSLVSGGGGVASFNQLMTLTTPFVHLMTSQVRRKFGRIAPHPAALYLVRGWVVAAHPV
jgi:hypothetical protein